MPISIKIKGLAELQRKLGTKLAPALKAITRGVGELVRDEMAKAPPPRSGPMKWATAKQARFYFAMRKREGLDPHYTRGSDPMSQRLETSWTVEGKGETGTVVGTRATYGPWVHKEGKHGQQPFHRDTGWVTEKTAAEKVNKSGNADRIAEDVVRKYLG